jgi:hypothetical protein
MAEHEQKDASIQPVEFLTNALKWWWALVILGLVGALCGVAIASTAPKVFEAHREIAVGIDLTQTGDLSDSDEDRLMQDVVGRVLLADVVGPLEINIKQNEVIWAERFQYAITLRVRAASPERAKVIADQWAEFAIVALQEAASQANVTAALRAAITDMTTCIQQSVSMPYGVSICESLINSEWDARLLELSNQLKESSSRDYGFAAGMSFTGMDASSLANRVTTSQGLAGLAGSLIGLLTGYTLLSLGWLTHRRKGHSRA